MHHCELSLLISINLRRVTTVLISYNQKRHCVKVKECESQITCKITVNLRTKVEICISTYPNADVVCYSAATCTLVRHFQTRFVVFECRTHSRASSV